VFQPVWPNPRDKTAMIARDGTDCLVVSDGKPKAEQLDEGCQLEKNYALRSFL
jgi:hypothetical protein